MSREFSLNQVDKSRSGGWVRVILMAVLISVIGLMLSQSVASAQSRNIDLGISVSDGRLRDFYLAIGDHYGVPPQQVVEIRDRHRCPDDELPVVFFLAARSHVEPAVIFNLRLKKMSWLDISFHYGLTPEIFFVPLTLERVGPPYGNAYGYYRKHGPAREWKMIVLTDREIIDLVNLRFMSEYYRTPPETVMAMRGRGNTFVVINEEIRKEKGKPAKQNQRQNKKKRRAALP